MLGARPCFGRGLDHRRAVSGLRVYLGPALVSARAGRGQCEARPEIRTGVRSGLFEQTFETLVRQCFSVSVAVCPTESWNFSTESETFSTES